MLTTSAFAQNNQRGGGPTDRGNRGGFNLDEKQRNLLREAMQENSDESRKLDEQLRAAQQELLKAVMAAKLDEALVREKAEAISKIQVEITLLRAKGFSVLVPTLTPEQREQMQNSPFIMMMLSGGGGMRDPMDRGARAAEGRGQGRGAQGRGGDRPPQ